MHETLAFESFDAPSYCALLTSLPATRHDNVLVLAGCEFLVEDDGTMVEEKSGLRSRDDWASFLKAAEKACGCRGATTGHGPHPRDVAVKNVVAFFQETLSGATG